MRELRCPFTSMAQRERRSYLELEKNDWRKSVENTRGLEAFGWTAAELRARNWEDWNLNSERNLKIETNTLDISRGFVSTSVSKSFQVERKLRRYFGGAAKGEWYLVGKIESWCQKEMKSSAWGEDRRRIRSRSGWTRKICGRSRRILFDFIFLTALVKLEITATRGLVCQKRWRRPSSFLRKLRCLGSFLFALSSYSFSFLSYSFCLFTLLFFLLVWVKLVVFSFLLCISFFRSGSLTWWKAPRSSCRQIEVPLARWSQRRRSAKHQSSRVSAFCSDLYLWLFARRNDKSWGKSQKVPNIPIFFWAFCGYFSLLSSQLPERQILAGGWSLWGCCGWGSALGLVSKWFATLAGHWLQRIDQRNGLRAIVFVVAILDLSSTFVTNVLAQCCFLVHSSSS